MPLAPALPALLALSLLPHVRVCTHGKFSRPRKGSKYLENTTDLLCPMANLLPGLELETDFCEGGGGFNFSEVPPGYISGDDEGK